MTKQTLQIIWHSRTGASQQLASAAQRGAQDALTALEVTETHQVRSTVATDVGLKQLLHAQAFIFCAPENLVSLSGEMKAFFDRHYYAAVQPLHGGPYSTIISAGTDGDKALKQVEQ